jgi:phosphopentomutase
MKRAIVIVLDGVGAGAAPDAADFNDLDNPSTLLHVWEASGGFHAPNLARLGFLAAGGIPVPGDGRYGRLRELSMGKDSVTGHWEMMGIHTEKAFPTYPEGFPISLIKAFEKEIGTQTIGNRAASGTAIIQDLGPLHVDTGFPIVYTSADSVFQIACHEEVVPIEQLYEYCRIARRLCQEPDNVQRVIARPFIGNEKDGFKRTERRKDFPYPAPPNLVDEIGDVYGIGVVPELFDGRGFRKVHRTQSNAEHEKVLFEAMESDARFIFANFEDFDMLYGHRNDALGFAKCLERFDQTLAQVLSLLKEEDLLIITADHGNDPTDPSTDHSREYVPVVVTGAGVQPQAFGDIDGMMAVGRTVAEHIGVKWEVGKSLIE